MPINFFPITIIVLLGCLVAIEILTIKYNGTLVPAPNIPRSSHVSNTGPQLTYVVMGDSTSIGQGAEYNHSYAMKSAEHLAQKYAVTLINTGVSGARTADILSDQIDEAIRHKPDVVLLGVGANDVTHFTNTQHLQNSLQQIIDALKQANPEVRIIATRSPAMDSVSRFPLISKFILRIRTTQVNKAFDLIIEKNNLTPALIAEGTRDAFLADPSLTAADNFHPNEKGYALWTPIINSALDLAVDSSRSQ
jgi:acyl-CoA thioesterase I